MNLIIVESPTKARTLGKFLGKDYSVEATMGHILDLPKSKLGVDIENNFKPDFVEVEKQKGTIKKLQTIAKKASQIFIASDPDREGEAIAQHVVDVLRSNNKSQMTNAKLKRITFHEITKDAVELAIKSPTDIDTNLVDAQIARRVLDRLVGYQLSPLLWKKVRRGLSAGRVQSVAVRLIVEKEREIEKFKSEEYWELFAQVKGKRQEVKDFTTQLVKIDGKTAEVKNKETADKIISDLEKSNYKVLDVRKKEVKKSPYPPFTTSTMTQAGARLFGWSSKKTMSVAQKLYEEGLITYHRTDSLNLNINAVNSARSLIQKEYGEKYLPQKPHFYKTHSKSAQEAHEAIRPTDVNSKFEISNSKYGHDEEKLYELIWKRFIACQMNPAVYSETAIDVEAKGRHPELAEGWSNYLLRASGQIMIFDGWRKVIQASGQSDDLVELPNVSVGEDLEKQKIWGDQKFTQPPARYNEASLIKTLEKLGIGRPSTYAPTISTIQIRAYVEKNDSKQFIPTSIGIAVNDFLIGNFSDTFDYQFTANMEESLDEIADGKTKWQKPIKDFYKPLEVKIKDVEKNAKRVKIEVEKLGLKCPDCKDGDLVIRTGRFGKFISCSKFPDCKHTERYLEKIGITCPECKKGEIIIKKTGKGRKFFGCTKYPKCKFASWENPKLQKQT